VRGLAYLLIAGLCLGAAWIYLRNKRPYAAAFMLLAGVVISLTDPVLNLFGA